MEKVLLSGIISIVIAIAAGPKFIEFLRRNELGQHIREEGPAGHEAKQGTPTMGGLLIMIAMTIPFLLFTQRTLPALTAFDAPAMIRKSSRYHPQPSGMSTFTSGR